MGAARVRTRKPTFPMAPRAPDEVEEGQVGNDGDDGEWNREGHSDYAPDHSLAVMRLPRGGEARQRGQKRSGSEERGRIEKGNLNGRFFSVRHGSRKLRDYSRCLGKVT